jgi:hypothetical protein
MKASTDSLGYFHGGSIIISTESFNWSLKGGGC